MFFFDKLLSKSLKYVSITADFSTNLPEKFLRDMGTRFNQCFPSLRSRRKTAPQNNVSVTGLIYVIYVTEEGFTYDSFIVRYRL